MTYEYLLAGLPELKAGSDAPISLEKLDELLDEQLRASDKALLDLLRAPMNEETLEQGLKAKNRFTGVEACIFTFLSAISGIFFSVSYPL